MMREKLTNLAKLTKEEFAQFINSFDTVLTDCDGVLWLDNQVIDKAPQVLNRLRELGKRIFYVTNNSTKLREELVEKCTRLKFICSKDEVITTAYLTAKYLKNKGFDKTVYLVGSNGISRELDLVGIKHTGIGPDTLQTSMFNFIDTLELDAAVGAVVVGYDEHISFPKITRAASYLYNPDCLFVATNTDERFPMASTLAIPGAGCMVAPIALCANRQPIIIGKPNTFICDILMNEYNIDPKRTIMIGDRCNTDILLGTRCGFNTLLVLSGISKLAEVIEWRESKNEDMKGYIPNVYIDKLGDLLQFID